LGYRTNDARTRSAALQCLLAVCLALAFALLYVRYLEPIYPNSPEGKRSQQQVQGVAGRGAMDDEFDYLLAARNLNLYHTYALDIGRPTAKRQPLYPMYLAFLFHNFGQSIDIALLGNAIAVACIPALTFLVARRLFDERTAVRSSYICAFNPALYFFGVGMVYAEALTTVFIMAAFAFWLAARVKQGAQCDLLSLTAGLLFGASALTRSGLLLLPLLLAASELLFPCRRKRLASIAAMCLGVVVAISPWIARNAESLHQLVVSSTNDGITLLGSVLAAKQGRGDWLNPASVGPVYEQIQRAPNELFRNQAARNLALREMRSVPLSRWMKVLALRTIRFWIPANRLVRDEVGRKLNLAINLLYTPAFLLGLFALFKTLASDSGSRRMVMPVVVYFCYMSLISMAVWGSTRFRYPLEPFIAVFTAVGILQVYEAVSDRCSDVKQIGNI
jgi:4-amino-4-deoxy-L-arabinose transferase-like glycosyltransferase